jgi:glycosyltransferase
MKISVITATFNSASTLEATIASFSSQTYPDKELIIVDGGSKDGTLEIIRAAGKKVNKSISEPDGGIYDALNKGIGMSEGDVIGFLHSGDQYPTSEILEKIAKKFMEHDADAVYGDLRYVNRKKAERVVRYWNSGEFYPNLLNKGWMPPHPTLYLKKEVYQKHGLFDLSFRIASDYDLILRVLKDPKLNIAYIPEVLVDMETGGLSNGKLVNVIQKSREDFRAMKKNGIRHAAWALGIKNLGKIPQFFRSS